MKLGMRFGLAIALAALATACGGAAEKEAREDGRPATTTETAPGTEMDDSGGEEVDVALIEAARGGDAEAVRRLLDDGASVEARGENGETALIAAAYGNHLQAAESLVEAGADVNVQDETQQGAYLIATSEVGDDPRLLRLTLENGADVRSLDSYNGTGLIRAADRGHVEIVSVLLQTDIDVDHVNNLGWTALLEAIILGDGGPRYEEIVRLLVEEGGADPNLADGEGVTPLQHAEGRGYGGISQILRNAGDE